MLALCEESKEAGIKTLVMLDDQGGNHCYLLLANLNYYYRTVGES